MNEDATDDPIPRKKFKISKEKNEIRICKQISAGKADTEAGSYFIGPPVKKYGQAPVEQYLVREKGSDYYYSMKILVLDDFKSPDKSSLERRSIFHNEYSILSLLKDFSGVVQIHDFFKEIIIPEKIQNQHIRKRVCMVLECLIPHGHHNIELIPLNYYLTENKLSETESLYIFYNLMLVIQELHNRNVVHADLKLSNIILNRKTLKVKLIDFYYAKLLMSSKDSQGKTSSLPWEKALPKTWDVWSAGVILYTMLKGGNPDPGCLNSSLRDDYIRIENEGGVCISEGIREILRNIFVEVPKFRMGASEAVDMVSTLLAVQSSSQNKSLCGSTRYLDQIVPECPNFNSKANEERQASCFQNEDQPRFQDQTNNNNKPNQSAKTAGEESERRFKNSSTTSRQNELLNSRELKVAMLRLGVTSINSINALSFSYIKKNSCRS